MADVAEGLQDAGAGRVRRRVVVIGGGFGGLNAAQGLGGLPVDVTLVDRKNYYLFQPLLYQVALAVLSPADIAQPIRSIMRNYKNVEVLMDEVVGFDLVERHVLLKTEARLEYDYLIVASGSTHSYFGREDWVTLAPGLKTIELAASVPTAALLSLSGTVIGASPGRSVSVPVYADEVASSCTNVT